VEAAPDYWVVEGYGEPMADCRGKRVVLTEFAIEFVTEALELPIMSQVMATPGTPTTVAGTAVGVGKSTFAVSPEQQTEIATKLYRAFVEEMSIRGLDVVPPSVAAMSASYDKLIAAERSSTGLLQRLNFIGTDTGRIKRMERAPPSGGLVVGATSRYVLELVQRELMEEFDAEYAMTVKFRVGLYRGRGSVESGSLWRLWDASGRSIVRSERSLLTDQDVFNESHFEFWRGDVSTVDSERYVAGLAPVMRAYTQMAFEVLEAEGARLASRAVPPG